jgi:hypothetical protein
MPVMPMIFPWEQGDPLVSRHFGTGCNESF